MDKYIQRLFNEWQQHGKIIVAVDYDDTVYPWRNASTVDCDRVIRLLKEVKLVGAYIVVFTACHEDRYSEIKDYLLTTYDLQVDGINTTPIDLPYGNDRKIYANVFLDDRAGLDESMQILSEAMYRMRSYNASKRLDNPGSTEF